MILPEEKDVCIFQDYTIYYPDRLERKRRGHACM